MSGQRRGARRLVTVTAGALVVSACLPRSVTAEGRDITTTYLVFLALAAVVALVVIVPATFAIIRYRAGRVRDLPVQTRGNVKAEVIWTLLPALTVAGLFALTFATLVRVDPPEDATATVDGRAPVEVRVTAFRWGWSFRYPDADVTISGIGAPGPEIYVPVDEPILFRLTAADVIHSFFVPAFLQKRDANPGRENVMKVTIEEEGTYRGQCAEYCGIYHWRMPFAVIAVPRGDFDAWLAEQPRGGTPTDLPLGSPLASPAAASPSPNVGGQPLDQP